MVGCDSTRCTDWSADGNLYIGTSTAEILHFVYLAPDSPEDSNEPSFILASRLPITYSKHASPPPDQHGVQQIVLLPTVNKACILCNGTVTFYLMPELSPAFGNTKVSNCRWIGGLDLNADPDEFESPVVMIADHSRIMLVRIGDEARRIRNIQFPGCLVASRRGTIACAADTHAYSLLDVEHQQKIPLFPISSSSEAFESGHVEDIPPAPPQAPKRSPSPSHPGSGEEGHAREASATLDTSGIQPDRSRSMTPDLSSSSGTPPRSNSGERDQNISPRPSREQTPEPQASTTEASKPLPPLPKHAVARLKPHVLSPTPSEFLLVTGTEETEPGVGMFVNMDGDVVPRGTINFDRYPESIVIDRGEHDNLLRPDDDSQEERVLAVVDASQNGKACKRLEVQRWDIDTAEAEGERRWVDIPFAEDARPAHIGLRHTTSPSELEFHEMGHLLRRVRLKTPSFPPNVPAADPRTQASIEQFQKEKELLESQMTDSDGSRKEDNTPERDWEAERNAEEAKFARGLGMIRGSLIMWAGNQVWRVLRNPLTIQLDDALRNALQLDGNRKTLDRDVIAQIIGLVQNTEPKSEAEFLGLNYVKQKASLLLFEDLASADSADRDETAIKDTEVALITGDMDPRVVLLLIPLLQSEVLHGPQGIWIHAGLAAIAEPLVQQITEKATSNDVLEMVKRFLFSWQQKRGYGSIMDDTYVFDSVDGALLHLLLEQDSNMATEQRTVSPIRVELNRLIDNWKGNFDRAVTLLENYNRLFILSRLYQSQKMSRNVLKTWRRIIEGETDAGGEVTVPGVEAQMRRYLAKIKDVQLVEEYGTWLAGRNPSLGIQVFVDSNSRVQFQAADVVALLKARAPNAVQEYLEHLVFSKNVSAMSRCLSCSNSLQYTQYADDLITYYLDTVTSVLESSSSARASLAESYSTYRALRPPKPTYMNFITENAPSDPWWQSRLRLLQLLGGGSSTQFTSMPSQNLSYSIPTILARIEPFQNELVSESIILDGLQGRHREALRLLTHGLGDYDSAVRYCLFGGPRSTSTTGPLAEFAERSRQSELFKHLLDEFLHIQDVSERIERTSDLLGRFASWFDVGEVLGIIPDDWSVDILSGFLAHVFRVLVSETREVRIERALSASLNLRVGTEYIEGMEKLGGWVESPEGVRRLRDSDAVD